MEDKSKDQDVPFWSSCRLTMVYVSFFMFVSMYMQRTNLSVAIVCMVNHTALKQEGLENDSEVIVDSECGRNLTSSQQDGEFLWDKNSQGLMLSSFFWGYLVTQIPGGWLAKMIGAKIGWGVCQMLASILTMLAPPFAKWHSSLFMTNRILVGLCGGVGFPCFYNLVSIWSPPLERSRIISYAIAGIHIGTIVSLPMAGVLCSTLGWEWIFYLFGAFGCVIVIWWFFVVYDTPEKHPRISQAEKDYIENALEGQVHKHEEKHHEMPWKDIVTSWIVWLLVFTYTCFTWGLYTLLTNLPTYMFEILRFDMTANGFISSLPYIASFLAMYFAGSVADYLITMNYLSTVNVRKIWTAIGLLGPGVFLVIAGHIHCSAAGVAVTMMVIGNFCNGFIFSGNGCAHVDVAPRYASLVFALMNTFAQTSGIVAPYVIGMLTTNQTEEEWRLIFYINLAVAVSGAVIFCLLMRGDILPWATVYDHGDDGDNKSDINKLPNNNEVLAMNSMPMQNSKANLIETDYLRM